MNRARKGRRKVMIPYDKFRERAWIWSLLEIILKCIRKHESDTFVQALRGICMSAPITPSNQPATILKRD
jgi:hypothetical protein